MTASRISVVTCFTRKISSSLQLYDNHYRLHLLRQHICRKEYSTHADQVLKSYHKIGLNEFVYKLTTDERKLLLKELQREQNTLSDAKRQKDIQIPTANQLQHVAVFAGIPFIGFGLLDNMIMLTAGEYIDVTFGSVLGITTMAAAALGNMISDVMGITTAGFVEQTVTRLGFQAPPITLEQMNLKKTKIIANLGRCVGVCIGCVLGMWPLLVINQDDDKTKDKSIEQVEKTPATTSREN